MPKRKNRKPAIKWRQKDIKKLSNTVRKFNAKRTSEITQNPKAEDWLPEKMNVKQIRDVITTRSDYNYIVNTLERFMRKDATKKIRTEGGKDTTKWAMYELRYANQRRNAKRAAARKKANVSPEKGTMGTIAQANLNPRTFNKKMGPGAWDSFKRQVQMEVLDSYDEKRRRNYMENYMESIASVFGLTNAFYLVDLLEKLDADDFVQAYHDDPILSLDYHYSDNDQLEDLANIYEHWIRWIMKNNIL